MTQTEVRPVTLAELARRCGVTVPTVRGWLARGEVARLHVGALKDVAAEIAASGEPVAPSAAPLLAMATRPPELTVAELARCLGVTSAAVQHWRCVGAAPPGRVRMLRAVLGACRRPVPGWMWALVGPDDQAEDQAEGEDGARDR